MLVLSEPPGNAITLDMDIDNVTKCIVRQCKSVLAESFGTRDTSNGILQ